MTPTNRNLIDITDEEKREIRQDQEIDDQEKIRDGIAALKDWCSKQHHFVEKDIGEFTLEKLLILSKGSVEEAKKRIDLMLTTRGMFDDIVLNRTPEEFKTACRKICVTALPKLNSKDRSRTTIFSFLTDNNDDFDWLMTVRFQALLIEYRYHFDYAIAERIIYDLKNFNFKLLTSLNPVILKKGEILAQKAHGLKVKGIHLVNAPPFVDKIVYLIKQVVRGKLTERIHVHDSYEDLHKHVCREVLPKDYGGEEQPLSQLYAKWVEELSSPGMKRFCITSDRLVTDETKRLNTNPFKDDYLGMQGNFRKLNVD